VQLKKTIKNYLKLEVLFVQSPNLNSDQQYGSSFLFFTLTIFFFNSCEMRNKDDNRKINLLHSQNQNIRVSTLAIVKGFVL
jgi:hypothetical protein